MTRNTGLNAVEDVEHEELPVSSELGWLKHRIGKLVAGGTYLLSGEPGIGKSTLSIQLALDLGRQGIQTIYILTEQSASEVAARAKLMVKRLDSSDAHRACGNVIPEEWGYDLKELPNFLHRNVLAKGGKYRDARMIVIDSIQGKGVSPLATGEYKHIYEFCDTCKASHITTVLVTHVTKSGSIAGPKSLEHKVDCVMYMKKALVYRPLFVPKNRFGPAVLRPIPLEMHPETTELVLSRLTDVQGGVARTFMRQDYPHAEAQAIVSLPDYGSKGQINAPNLRRDEIKRILHVINQIPDMDVGDLSYSIQCNLPGGKFYDRVVDLALAMALLSSYLQKEIPRENIYLGEVDLLRSVKPVDDDVLMQLYEAITGGILGTKLVLHCSEASAALIKKELGPQHKVMPCETLEDAVYQTWPELRRALRREESEDED